MLDYGVFDLKIYLVQSLRLSGNNVSSKIINVYHVSLYAILYAKTII